MIASLPLRRLIALAVLCGFAAPHVAWGQEAASYISHDESRLIWADGGGMDTITALLEANGLAAATGTAMQSLVDNRLFETDSRIADISGSFNSNTGVFDVNQSSGNVNNQANVKAIALVGSEQSAVQIVQSAAVQELRGNELETSGSSIARIENSFNDTVGIVGVNQAAGSLNQQLNVLSLTFGHGIGPVTAVLADASLAQIGTSQDNILNEDPDSAREQSVNNSFNNFAGIAQGSVVAGNMNRVANVLSVSVQTMGAP